MRRKAELTVSPKTFVDRLKSLGIYEDVQNLTLKRYAVPARELPLHVNDVPHASARAEFMIYMTERFRWSTTEIGKLLGRDHTTVSMAMREHRKRMGTTDETTNFALEAERNLYRDALQEFVDKVSVRAESPWNYVAKFRAILERGRAFQPMLVPDSGDKLEPEGQTG